MENKGLLHGEPPPPYTPTPQQHQQQSPYAPSYQYGSTHQAGTQSYPGQNFPSAPNYQQATMQNQTSTTIITQQPQNPHTTISIGEPPSYKCLSWVSCLFCFWPIGLAAIMKSYEVNPAFVAGDVNRAYQLSRKAKKFSILSIILGLIVISILIIYLAFYYEHYYIHT